MQTTNADILNIVNQILESDIAPEVPLDVIKALEDAYMICYQLVHKDDD